MSEYPRNLDATPAWKPDQEFLAAAREVRMLREAEKRGGAISKRTERILALLTPDDGAPSFAERYARKGAPVALWPDANGLRFDIGGDNEDGIHSHIPYEFMTDEALAGAAALMDDGPLADTRTRIAIAHEREDAADLAKRQEERFFRIAAPIASLAELMEAAPETRLRAFLEGESLPAQAYEAYLAPGEGTEHERVMALAALASELNAAGSHAHDALRSPLPAMPAHPPERTREAPRFTRAVFEHRERSLYENPLNAEASKILSLLFTHYDPKTLHRARIETVRGAFARGTEFIALYSGTQYERILVDPKKHVRGADASKHYARVPLVKNADFEAFEGLMLPYVHVRALAASLEPGTTEEPTAQGARILSVLSLLVSELPPTQYEPLYLAGTTYGTELSKGIVSEDARRAFKERLDEVLATYSERFSGPALEILDRYLKLPERRTLSFDEALIKEAPPALQEKMRIYRDTLSLRNPEVTVIRSGTEHQIPFAFEGRALRALSIENRPALTLICGAKYENVEEQAMLDHVTSAIIRAGIRAKTNTFMQGTQSGKIAETMVRKHWEYRASLPEGAVPASRLMAVEPGKSIYFGPLGYPDTEKDAHAPLPIDAILTPYVAGWSSHGTMHSYLSHLVLRQSIIHHASNGQPRVSVVINGGSWSVLECIESLKDGGPLIVLPESGRLAALLAHLAKTRDAWHAGGATRGLETLQAYAAEQPAGARERLQEDLVAMKNRGLLELIELASTPGAIIEATSETLEDTVVSLLTPKE